MRTERSAVISHGVIVSGSLLEICHLVREVPTGKRPMLAELLYKVCTDLLPDFDSIPVPFRPVSLEQVQQPGESGGRIGVISFAFAEESFRVEIVTMLPTKRFFASSDPHDMTVGMHMPRPMAKMPPGTR